MRGAGRARLGLLAGLIGLACGGSISLVDGIYRDGGHDFTIDAPAGPGPAWERMSVDDAALSFRRDDSGRRDGLSMLVRCGRAVADAQLMARSLVIGLDERELMGAGPSLVAGRNGWTQSFETSRDGVTVLVKTVTLVAGDCTFDWVLVAAGPRQRAETAFDAWWGSFRLGSSHAEEGP